MRKNNKKKSLQIISISFLLILPVLSGAPNCSGSSYCQECENDATSCSSCYTWGTGDILKDKIWASSTSEACTALLPLVWKVTNCKINILASADVLNASIKSVSPTNHPRCYQCDDFKYLNWTHNGTVEKCTNSRTVLYYKGDETFECIEIKNCGQTICASGETIGYQYCGWC